MEIMEEKKVVIAVTGGLGNQMFFYALYKYLQLKRINVYLDLSWYSGESYSMFQNPYIEGEVKHCVYKLENYFMLPDIKRINIEDAIKIANERLERQITCDNSSSSYISMALENANVYLTGFYRNWDYIYKIRNELVNDFAFLQPVPECVKIFLEEIEKSTSVSIHIRRGDYFINELFAIHNGSICTIDYFKNAIDYLQKRVGNLKLFIFSDSPSWVRENISFVENIIVDIKGINNADYIDLFLMSKCKYNIIANSSFSWWAAFLNENKNNVIICPPLWNRNLNFEKTDYICPPEWIRVSNNPEIHSSHLECICPIIYILDFPIKDHSFKVFDDEISHLAISIQSILDNTNYGNKCVFYIFHQYISDENSVKIKNMVNNFDSIYIELIDITEFILKEDLYTKNKEYYYTFNNYGPYIKFFIPYILHQYDHLLYLSNNAIINCDIFTIIEKNLNVNSFVCCRDVINPEIYSVNMMIINVKKMKDILPLNFLVRSINENMQILALSKEYNNFLCDQLFLNIFFKDNISVFNGINDNEMIFMEYDEPWQNIQSLNIQNMLKYASRANFFDKIWDQLWKKYNSLLSEKMILSDRLYKITSSYSYRVGRVIVWLPRMTIIFWNSLKQNGIKVTMKFVKRKIVFVFNKVSKNSCF